MPKKPKNLKPKVLFNASVILSGINSPKGGSARVLLWVKKRKIEGVITEIIFDEILRHSEKFSMSKSELSKKCLKIFASIQLAPNENEVKKQMKIVLDPGDAHVLASAKKMNVNYLVTLDKKHLLVLKNKIRLFKIVTPGELIKELSS